MSVEDINRAVETARRDSARVMFFQRMPTRDRPRPSMTQIGARVSEINPLDYDWKGNVDIANAMAS